MPTTPPPRRKRCRSPSRPPRRRSPTSSPRRLRRPSPRTAPSACPPPVARPPARCCSPAPRASVCSVSGNTVTMLSAGMCALDGRSGGRCQLHRRPASHAVGHDRVPPRRRSPTSSPIRRRRPSPRTAPSTCRPPAAPPPARCSFASTTTAVCTVTGNTVRMLSSGQCALTANQAGDGNYTAAPQATLNVTIGAAMPTAGLDRQPRHDRRPGPVRPAQSDQPQQRCLHLHQQQPGRGHGQRPHGDRGRPRRGHADGHARPPRAATWPDR